jgi:hypothetical protein
MNRRSVRTGFTVAELLVAMVVTSVVLLAVTTLAFAMGSASRAAEDVEAAQAEIRAATVRLMDLIHDGRMICAAQGDDVVVWKSDDNADGLINLNELVYLERDTVHGTLRMCQFSDPANPVVAFSSLSLAATKATLKAGYASTDVILIRSCSGIQFACDQAPPLARRLVISFDQAEDQTTHHYQIDAAVLGSAACLLNAGGTDLVTDDD